MFRTLIYPSSGACDCWRTSCASACNMGTTQIQPPQISNTQRTENKTTDVENQQHSRKLLMMDISMSETCWAHKKWNIIASDIKLVFYSSNITMMHGPINIRNNTFFATNSQHHQKHSKWEHLIFRESLHVAHYEYNKYTYVFKYIKKEYLNHKYTPTHCLCDSVSFFNTLLNVLWMWGTVVCLAC